jgi:acetoin utilization deacetylase AcuC-like enzyme
VAARPPGHHAETHRAMGFCLFNNIAAAARHAQAAHGMERVAIFDWDVHHGNGTQEIFWDDASVLYASTHQMPLFPGTGAMRETGAGNIFNAPLSPGDGSERFREAVRDRVLPAIESFRPDMILISAGFDAHWRDPLAQIELTEEDFAWATAELMELADRFAGGRIVSVLEGGYDLEGLSKSAAAHIRQLMQGERQWPRTKTPMSPPCRSRRPWPSWSASSRIWSAARCRWSSRWRCTSAASG